MSCGGYYNKMRKKMVVMVKVANGKQNQKGHVDDFPNGGF